MVKGFSKFEKVVNEFELSWLRFVILKKIKILYVIDSLARGGTELQLTGLIDRLDRRRFTPYLCTLRDVDPVLLPTDCPHLIYKVPRLFSANGVVSAWRLSRFLKSDDFTVVQTFFQDATVFGGVAACLASTPIRLACFRDLGFWRTRAQALMQRCVYSMMTGFLANAVCVRDNFSKHGGIKRDAIQVIYNGIDPDSLPWVEHDGPTLHIGIVGNLNRRVKRTDLFLRAAVQVSRKHPQITWYVVGDGCYRSEYEQLACKEGIGDRTVFTGNIECVADYLGKFQVGVLCSDSEGFSNALLEYMLCGCATVVTRVGGNPEAVIDGQTGLLVPPDNVEALAGALLKVVEDISLRRKMAEEARRSVATNFGWNRCVTAHEAIYENVT
ncbi:MAG: glycosyltransferase involved in cell wall biosynthesis [Desulforhopalus sp.]